MRKGFTLIELLVVMIIMTTIMAMVVPKGSKMLDSFSKNLEITKERQKLSKERSLSFIQGEEKNIDILDNSYHISSKGLLTKLKQNNDND